MALTIKPVKVSKSVYIRIPSNIAELLELNREDEFKLSFENTPEEVRLIYSRRKHPVIVGLRPKNEIAVAQPSSR
jgi:antitoxin component of MazEF toxin-antitoxin module